MYPDFLAAYPQAADSGRMGATTIRAVRQLVVEVGAACLKSAGAPEGSQLTVDEEESFFQTFKK